MSIQCNMCAVYLRKEETNTGFISFFLFFCVLNKTIPVFVYIWQVHHRPNLIIRIQFNILLRYFTYESFQVVM